MEILLAVLLITYALKKAVADSIVDNNYAKQGLVSPRFEAQHGREAAAKVDKYGFFDFLRDNYRDYWSKLADAKLAARNATDTDGDGKVSLKERLAAAKQAMTEKAAPVAQKAAAATANAVRKVVAPVEPKTKPEPTPEATPLAVDAGDVPDGTKRIAADGSEERWDDASKTWQPILTRQPGPRHAAPEPPTPQPTTGGTPVTAATGEATNFASAVPELDALTRDVTIQHDQAASAKRHLETVDGAVDGFQPRQQRIGQVAQSLAEHLTEKNVEAAVVQPVLEAAEALSPNDAAALLEHIEAAKAILDQIIVKTEAAQAALTQARSLMVGTLADAADTVRQRLHGDARFLADQDGTGGGTVFGHFEREIRNAEIGDSRSLHASPRADDAANQRRARVAADAANSPARRQQAEVDRQHDAGVHANH